MTMPPAPDANATEPNSARRLWLIIFMHETDPAVRVVEGTESEAQTLLLRVRAIYDDAEARMVPFYPSHRDNDQIEADYADLAATGAFDD